jgi:hypothetical protein
MTGKDFEGSGSGLIKALSQDVTGGTGENHKKKTSLRIAGAPAEILTK